MWVVEFACDVCLYVMCVWCEVASLQKEQQLVFFKDDKVFQVHNIHVHICVVPSMR